MILPDILLESVYVLTGLLLFIFAALTLKDPNHPHPKSTATFWLILGIIFIAGTYLPHAITGVLVLIMVAIDGAGKVKPTTPPPRAKEESASTGGGVEADSSPPISAIASNKTTILSYAHRQPPNQTQSILGNKIFLPVLTIPTITILFALTFRILKQDVTTGALIGLGFGGLSAMLVALALTKGSLTHLLNDGRHLNECMGAVNILPQLLASLGIIFTAAGIGTLIANAVTHFVPHHLFLLIIANCLGMTLFTMVMGNSFAAFPVIAAGVLIPLIVKPFNVDPAIAAIITLTAGSSGTLITPMAANFNIVPAALLELKNPYAVLKFQLPYALILWPMHVIVMWALIQL